MNRIYKEKEKYQINLNTIFNVMFILYATLMYCFNNNTDNVKYIHIAWAGVVGIVILKMIFDIKSVVFFKEMIVLILYAAYCNASTLWANWSATVAQGRATTVIQMVIFTFVIVYYLTQIKDVRIVIWALIIAGLILSVYVPLSYGGFSAYYAQATAENARLGGEIDNENIIGMSCAYTVVLLFFAGMYYKKRWAYILMILPFIISMGSGSRKALIVIVSGLGLLLYLSQNKDKGSAVKIGKLILIFAVALLAFWLILKLPIMATVEKRMEDLFKTFSGNGGDNSSKLRQEMIKAGWKQFKKSPFFGVGISNSYYVNKYATGHFTYLHNDFIEQLVNLGIVGFLLYYGLLLSLVKSHMKLLKTRNPEVTISFVFLVIVLVNSYGMVTYYSKITYIFFAMWIAVVNIYKEKGNEKSNESFEEDGALCNGKNGTKYFKNIE